jgi:hypothetical protein
MKGGVLDSNWGTSLEYRIIYSIMSSLGGGRLSCSIYHLQLIDLTQSHVPLDRLLREATSRLHDLPISNPLPSVLLPQWLSQGFDSQEEQFSGCRSLELEAVP